LSHEKCNTINISNGKAPNHRNHQHQHQHHTSSEYSSHDRHLPHLLPLLTKGLMDYKSSYLYNIRYPEWSILIQKNTSERCEIIANPHVNRKIQYSCLVVVAVEAESSYNLLRFDLTSSARDQADDDKEEDEEEEEEEEEKDRNKTKKKKSNRKKGEEVEEEGNSKGTMLKLHTTNHHYHHLVAICVAWYCIL
jgi:hypothetical protein